MAASSEKTNKAQPIDAVVRVTVSSDFLTAFVTIDPPENDGKKATTSQIDEALRNAKVIFGIDEIMMINLKNQIQYSECFAIAHGIAPIPGENGSIEYNFRTSTEVKPLELENGTVDYRNLGQIVSVHKGDVLCTITLPTTGY